MAKNIGVVAAAFFGYLWHLSLYFVIFPFLVLYLGLRLDILFFDFILKVSPPPLFMVLPTVVGAGFLVIGLIVAAASLIYLRIGSQSFPLDVIHLREFYPKALVTTGIYSRVRHPMLLGYFLMLVGCALALSSPLSIFWTIPLFLWSAYEYTVLVEEKHLLSWFGEDYAKYRSTVPFLFPRFRTLESSTTGVSENKTKTISTKVNKHKTKESDNHGTH